MKLPQRPWVAFVVVLAWIALLDLVVHWLFHRPWDAGLIANALLVAVTAAVFTWVNPRLRSKDFAEQERGARVAFGFWGGVVALLTVVLVVLAVVEHR